MQCDLITTYGKKYRIYRYSQHSSIIWPIWLNSWMFVYELNGCGFGFYCCRLNFRYHACFGQGAAWHPGNYRVRITLKCAHDIRISYSQKQHTDKYSQHSSIIWSLWLNVFECLFKKVSGYGFKFHCRQLNLRYCVCLENRFSSYHIRRDTYSKHSSIIWPILRNGWVFVYKLSGCGFESLCCHLNTRRCAWGQQGVPWHSGNSRV